MSERIVSPGVFTRENDLSFLPQGIAEIGAAFVGPYRQGPAFVPTRVTSQADFAERFGSPDGTYYTPYAVENYLKEAGSATIVRVMNTEGYTEVPKAITLGDKIIGVLYSTDEEESIQYADEATAGTGDSFDIDNYTGSLDITQDNSVDNLFGTSAYGSKEAYSYMFFGSAASGSLSDAVAIDTLSEQTYDKHSSAHTPWIQSQEISDSRYDLFRFHTIGHGTEENTRFKISIYNVRPAGSDNNTEYATFSVMVRKFDDTDRRKSVLEQFNNVNLDPSSSNFIARVIGDMYYEPDTNTSGKINEFGDWTNRSKYIRVELSDDATPVSAAPMGHSAYQNPLVFTSGTLPGVVFQNRAENDNTASSAVYFSGIELENNDKKRDNWNYLKPIPDNAKPDNAEFSEDNAYGVNVNLDDDAHTRQFTVAFQGGFDGVSPARTIILGKDIGATNSQGFNLDGMDASGSKAYEIAIDAISNADEYDINLITTPGLIREYHQNIVDYTIDMVERRQDCFYVSDFTPEGASIQDAVTQSNQVDSSYTGIYYPWVRTIDASNKMVSVPPSVLMPAVYAGSDNTSAEWFAPAGLTRGGITGAVGVVNRLTHSERDILYENKINPIASFPGEGIVAFGQKTLQDRASALDRINVRRLLIRVKKFFASTSRYLIFEQNTARTRNKFINTVQPYLEGIQQRQGLYSFRVKMDEDNNTPDIIDRNLLIGEIWLQPTRTAEFIILEFNIMPSGATFTD